MLSNETNILKIYFAAASGTIPPLPFLTPKDLKHLAESSLHSYLQDESPYRTITKLQVHHKSPFDPSV